MNILIKALIFGLLSLGSSNAFSQVYPKVEVDTVKMRVSVIDFFDNRTSKSGGLLVDILSKRVFIPTDSLNPGNLLGYLDGSADNNFNGIFFLSNDYHALFSYPLTEYVGLSQQQLLSSIPDLPINDKKTIRLPGQDDKRYRVHVLDGVFIKYTLRDFKANHDPARKKYIKYVKAADNRSFNYYRLIKQNSYEESYIF